MDLFITLGFCAGIAIVDSKTYRIPDILLIGFMVLIVTVQIFRHDFYITGRLLSATAAFLIFAGIYYVTGGIGFGDVKFAAVLGYVLKLELLVPVFMCAALLALLVYIIGIQIFHWEASVKLPFAPFLSGGVMLAVASEISFGGY